MKDLERRSRDIVREARSKLSPIEYIAAQVRQMDERDIADLAVAYLYGQVKLDKRKETRDAEVAAQRERLIVQEETSNRATWEEMTAEGYPWRKIIYCDWMTESPWEAWRRNNANRPDLLADRDAALKERQAQEEARSKENWAKMNAAIENLKATWRMEWTQELLSSELALGDGTVTTWGRATISDHQARMAMHKRNATAGLVGYQRHAQAVDELERTGASCLNEAVTKEAVSA